MFAPLVKWYTGGKKDTDLPKTTAPMPHTFWVFDPDEEPQEYLDVHKCAYPQPLAFPNAMGSGASYALGALYAKATLTEAVEIASRLDVYTGGEIKLIDIPVRQPRPVKQPSYWEGVLNAIRGHRS